MKKRFSEDPIIGFLRRPRPACQSRTCRKHGFIEALYYLRRNKFRGMSVPEAKRLKDLESENVRLKTLRAENLLKNEVVKEALRRKW